MRLLAGNRKPVTRLAYLPDGRLAGAGGAVGVWAAGGGGWATLAPADRVGALATSPCGRWLAWCDRRRLTVAPVDGDAAPQQLAGATDSDACGFSPDGRLLAVVCGGFEFFSVGDWEPVPQAEGAWAYHAFNAVAFAPDSNAVAARPMVYHGVSEPCGAEVWDIRAQVSRTAFAAGEHPVNPESPVTRLAYSPDGRVLAALRSPHLHVWDAATEEVLHTSRIETGPAKPPGLLGRLQARLPYPHHNRADLSGQSALAFSPCGRTLAVGGNDGVVTLRETGTWGIVRRYDWKLGQVHDVAFAPDGLTVAAACGRGGRVVVWDVDA